MLPGACDQAGRRQRRAGRHRPAAGSGSRPQRQRQCKRLLDARRRRDRLEPLVVGAQKSSGNLHDPAQTRWVPLRQLPLPKMRAAVLPKMRVMELPRCPSHFREIQLAIRNSAPPRADGVRISENTRCELRRPTPIRTETRCRSRNEQKRRAFSEVFSPHREPRLKRTPAFSCNDAKSQRTISEERDIPPPRHGELDAHFRKRKRLRYAYFRKIGGPNARFRKTPLWDSRPSQTMHTTYRWRGSIYG